MNETLTILKVNIIPLIGLLILVSCNSLKQELKITNKEFRLVKNDTLLIKSLKLSLKNSIDKKLIRRRLDSFYNGNYTKHELITSIELDRVFKGKVFEIDRKIDKEKAIDFDSIKDVKAYLNNIKKQIKNSLDNSKTRTDSIN